MKLGALKSQIRALKGNPPTIRVELVPGAQVSLALMKTALLASLDEAFPGGKAVETGMELRVVGDDAVLCVEGDNRPYGMGAAAPGPLLDIMEAPQPAAQPTSTLLDLDDPKPAAPASSTTLLV